MSPCPGSKSSGRWHLDPPATAGRCLGRCLGCGAVIPVAVAYGRIGWTGLWRGLSWAGALLLILYGGINTAVSNAVLAGWVVPAGGYNLPALAGHAWLWDPLFLLWGLCLCGYLLLSRSRNVKTGAPDVRT